MTNICPYLRSSSDRTKYLPYPTYQNRCYVTGQGKSVSVTAQTGFCLSGQWAWCPIRRRSEGPSDGRASPPTEIPPAKKHQRQDEEPRHLLSRVREAETLPISAKRCKATSTRAPRPEKDPSLPERTSLADEPGAMAAAPRQREGEGKELRPAKAQPPGRKFRHIATALALVSGLALLLLCLVSVLIYIYLGTGFRDIGDLALATKTPTPTALPAQPPATASLTPMPTTLPSLTAAPAPTSTPTPSDTPLPTSTSTPRPVLTSTPLSTPTDTPTSTITPDALATQEAAVVATATAEARMQEAARATMTAQAPTPTDTPTLTDTPTNTPTSTYTPTPTNTPTFTPTPPPTSTPISTPTPQSMPATSPPTRLIVPSIGLDAEVVEVGWQSIERDGKKVSVWKVADYAAGWHKGSAYPGNAGNIVISGHHNIKGEVFRYLVELKVGDEVYVYVGDVVYTYFVERNFIIPDKHVSMEQRRENAKWIAPTNDERLTLVTCWPYTNNTHRVVVIARPYEVTEYSLQPSD